MTSANDTIAASRSSGPALILVAFVVLVALAIGRDHPLQNLNEGVYARVAQEMLERRDFIVPTLDGVPYLEKPPLLYWVTAAAFAAFGTDEAVARLGPFLGALLTLGAAVWFAHRHLAPATDRYALAILGTAPIVVVLAHTLMFDLLFTGLLFAALVTGYEALERPSERKWLRWSYGLLAGAVLAKGLAALAFYVVTVAVWLWQSRRGARLAASRSLRDPIAVAILLLIGVPWHVLAALRQPGFAWLYFVNEHLLRFIDARIPHDYHTGPWWYYVPRIPQYLFPWILLLLLPTGTTGHRADERGARRFLWIAFLVPFVLFSLSRAKGEYYLVAGMPSLALLAADRIARAASPGKALEAMAIAWLVVVAVLLAIGRTLAGPYALPAGTALFTLTAGGLAALSLVAARSGRHGLATLACAAIAIPCVATYSNFLEVNEPAKSARSLASRLRGTSDRIYIFREFETLSALPFYLDSPVGVVDPHSGDLRNGLQLEPHPGRFPDIPTMTKRAATEPLWLVVPVGQRENFARNEIAAMFVDVCAVGPHELYASLPLAQRWEESSRGGKVASRLRTRNRGG